MITVAVIDTGVDIYHNKLYKYKFKFIKKFLLMNL